MKKKFNRYFIVLLLSLFVLSIVATQIWADDDCPEAPACDQCESLNDDCECVQYGDPCLDDCCTGDEQCCGVECGVSCSCCSQAHCGQLNPPSGACTPYLWYCTNSGGGCMGTSCNPVVPGACGSSTQAGACSAATQTLQCGNIYEYSCSDMQSGPGVTCVCEAQMQYSQPCPSQTVASCSGTACQ